MTTPLRCLIVEDLEDDARLLLRQLRDGGYEVTAERVDTPEAMQAALDRGSWDIVISDYRLPGFTGIAALELLKASGRDIPFILVSGTVGEETAVEAMRGGASDYLLKDRLARLVPAVQRELRETRIRAERRQLETEMQLRSAALGAAANAIVITDREGAVVWANAAFTVLTGYSLEEAMRKNPRELLKSDRHDRDFYAVLWQTILAGKVWHGELVNRRKDGSLYPEEMTITPVRGADGEIAHFIAIKEDLTPRKQSERALRESEALLRESQAVAGLGSYELDVSTGRFTNSEYLDEVFGITADYPHTADGWLALAHPSDNGGMVRYFKEEVLGQGKKFDREYQVVRRTDGATRWVWGTGRLEFDAQGRVIKMRGMVQDITDRKEAEEELRREQKMFSDLITTIPDRIYYKDRQSRFVRINESLARVFGLANPAEAIGKTDADFFLGEHARQARVDEERIMTTGEPLIGAEEKEAWPDGRVTWVSTTKVPLRDAAGKVTGLVGVSRDITEQKLLEEKFLHAQRLESIGMLAAGIAHDLNNVLAPIVFAAPMLRTTLTSERDLRILETVEQSAARGSGLVKQILGFAHSTTGEFRSTQVKHLARDIISVIEQTFPKNIEFEHVVPSDLWPAMGNPTQIHQVLLNLCVNARDAMPAGGKLSLTVTNRTLDEAAAGRFEDGRPGNWLELTVGDTGTGITPEVMEKIWTPFFTTKGIGKGTGLGLTTIRSIVASHKGFISLETAVGRGTTFRIFLPVAEGAATGPGSLHPFVKPPVGRGELILVVDDDDAVQGLVAAIVTKFGYRAVKCRDGVEAIGIFKAQAAEIALVITDVDMPHLGGVELAQALRRLCPEVRMVAISGLSHHGGTSPDVPSIRDLVQGFLKKPFRPEELLATVDRILHPAGQAEAS